MREREGSRGYYFYIKAITEHTVCLYDYNVHSHILAIACNNNKRNKVSRRNEGSEREKERTQQECQPLLMQGAHIQRVDSATRAYKRGSMGEVFITTTGTRLERGECM